jgi:hypothetical protein
VGEGKSIRASLFVWIWTMKQNVEKIGVCYTSHGTFKLAARGNDKARKRCDMKEDLLISSQPGIGYCLQARAYAMRCAMRCEEKFQKNKRRKSRWRYCECRQTRMDQWTKRGEKEAGPVPVNRRQIAGTGTFWDGKRWRILKKKRR